MKSFEIYLYKEVSNSIFDFLVNEILNHFKAILISKIDDKVETKYYDFSIDEYLITLHQTPILGISIFPTNNKNLEEKDINFYKELSIFLKSRIYDKI
jgi:hypothetical protein